ncbi:GTPase [bacterium CPR1]|nr:GTPase [bacterium CPR1]
MASRRILIMGAAGRDFHNFNVTYRDKSEFEVVAFTATQIPDIAGRRYPADLAGKLYPRGIDIFPEEDLESVIARLKVEEVVFAYSDVSYPYVMGRASRVLAAGADFTLLGPERTMLRSSKPVLAVCAVRTGVGKSQTTRYLASALRSRGKKVAILRHPMPYGDLAAQAVQRFEQAADLDRHGCTLEEREEYAPHLEEGHLVFAGVDYARILEAAEREADVILWDGGNNDLPFLVSDLHITLVDPLRAGHETGYYPGEVNLRRCHAVIVNKVDTATPEQLASVREAIARVNAAATVVEAASPPRLDDPEAVRGKRVLVVEDGPTLTHGEMAFGAGWLAARAGGASEILDPRPYAVGSLKPVYQAWPNLGQVLPAMGYSPAQREELRQTILASPAEVVVVGTPIDLGAVLKLERPSVRVRYNLEPREPEALAGLLERLGAGSARVR